MDEKALERAVKRAMENAGTLPAKEAVKLVPADWHRICDLVLNLPQALSPGSTGETEGWVLVPKELTEAMREATWRDQYQSAAGQHGMATDVVNECVRLKMVDAEQADQDRSAYRAMLSAAGERG